MDRFELESEILQFSNFSDQLRLISSAYVEGNLDDDRLINSLEGLAVLIELYQEKLFNSYKKCFALDEYYEK